MYEGMFKSSLKRVRSCEHLPNAIVKVKTVLIERYNRIVPVRKLEVLDTRNNANSEGVSEERRTRLEESWWLNELILDGIFKKLEATHLKVVRQVCHTWCSSATRLLSRSTSLSVGDWRSREELGFCGATIRDGVFVEITRIEKQYVFESCFKPREISILGSENLWRLPGKTIERVTVLKILHFAVDDADCILFSLENDFPNLQTLELTRPDPRRAHSTGGLLKPRDKYNTKRSVLKSLSITVPVTWYSFSWNFLCHTGTLNELDVSQDAFDDGGERGKIAAEHYGRIISAFPVHVLNESTATLRFGSHADTFMSVNKFCSSVGRFKKIRLIVKCSGHELYVFLRSMPHTFMQWELSRLGCTNRYICARLLGNARKNGEDETANYFFRMYSSIMRMSAVCFWNLNMFDTEF